MYIKNILFDLGNVLIPISPESTLAGLQSLGFKNQMQDVYRIPIFKEYEMGKVSTSVFIQTLQQILGGTVPYSAIIEAWNSMILPIDKQIFDFLQILSKQYQLFLVSNTNDLHAMCFEPKILDVTSQPIHSFFIKTYYSHILQMRKPEDNIFEYIIQNASIDPKETLFIDDFLDNVTTAQKLGFHTIYFTTPTDTLSSVISGYFKE